MELVVASISAVGYDYLFLLSLITVSIFRTQQIILQHLFFMFSSIPEPSGMLCGIVLSADP